MVMNLTCVKPHQEFAVEVGSWLPLGAQTAEHWYDFSKNKAKFTYKNILGYITKKHNVKSLRREENS